MVLKFQRLPHSIPELIEPCIECLERLSQIQLLVWDGDREGERLLPLRRWAKLRRGLLLSEPPTRRRCRAIFMLDRVRCLILHALPAARARICGDVRVAREAANDHMYQKDPKAGGSIEKR